MTTEQSMEIYGEDLTEVYGVMRNGPEVAERIKIIVAAAFSVHPKHMREVTRRRFIADARHVWRYLCRKYTNLTLQRIGEITTGANHSTVVHSLEQVGILAETDADFRRGLEVVDGFVMEDLSFTTGSNHNRPAMSVVSGEMRVAS